MYKVAKCIYQKNNDINPFTEGWIIESDETYPYLVNKFLHKAANGSSGTAKQYAYKLCSYLNYLEITYQINYIEASPKHLKNFIRYLQYGENIIPFGAIEGNKSGFTIQSYLYVLKSFYEYLYSQDIDLNLEFKEKRNINPHSYLYGQSWDTMIVKLQLDDSFERSKAPIQYEKWYTEEQKEAILENFNTYRDKAIFSITLDGCRIDEVLSSRMSDYDDNKGILTPYRSKGKKTGDTGRIVVLSERSISYLEDYLFYERSEVEIEFLEQGKLLPEEIFINIKKREESYGTKVQYNNILEIIKRAAEKAGIDPATIRTHSGRSTKASELFRYQAENPEKLSDNMIKEMMGWKSLDSSEPYKNKQDKETTLITAKKLKEIKDKRGNDNENS